MRPAAPVENAIPAGCALQGSPRQGCRTLRDINRIGDRATEFGYHAPLIGTVAQLVEQGPYKALVLGSSPSRPTFLTPKLTNLPPESQ